MVAEVASITLGLTFVAHPLVLAGLALVASAAGIAAFLLEPKPTHQDSVSVGINSDLSRAPSNPSASDSTTSGSSTATTVPLTDVGNASVLSVDPHVGSAGTLVVATA